MKPFSTLRNGRMRLDFREITIRDSISDAAIAGHEASTSAFLRHVVTTEGFDPLSMTVQERTMAICHYIMHVTDDDPNFRVGGGRLMDYMAFDKQYADPPNESVTVNGIAWKAQHLTGAFAESIERLQGAFPVPDGVYWSAGVMAAQLRNQDDIASVPEKIDDWMHDRIGIILDMPESAFHELHGFLLSMQQKMTHLFDVSVNIFDGGLQCMPLQQEGEGALLPPAIFQPIAAIHARTQAIHRLVSGTGWTRSTDVPS